MKSFVQNYGDKDLKKCGFISASSWSLEFIVLFSELSRAVFSDFISRQEVVLKIQTQDLEYAYSDPASAIYS